MPVTIHRKALQLREEDMVSTYSVITVFGTYSFIIIFLFENSYCFHKYFLQKLLEICPFIILFFMYSRYLSLSLSLSLFLSHSLSLSLFFYLSLSPSLTFSFSLSLPPPLSLSLYVSLSLTLSLPLSLSFTLPSQLKACLIFYFFPHYYFSSHSDIA